MMLTRSDVYGAQSGGRTSEQRTKGGNAPADPSSTGVPTTAQSVANSGPRIGINPLYGLAILGGGLVGYKLLREWGRDHDADKDIKVALHNGVVVTAFALAGVPIAKAIADVVNNHAPAMLKPITQPVRDYVLNA